MGDSEGAFCLAGTAPTRYFAAGRNFLRQAPGDLARRLGVPVVHAAQAGEFEGLTPGNETVPFVSRFLGETQITDGHGNVLTRLAYEDGEGVVTADITPGRIAGDLAPIPQSFWTVRTSDGTEICLATCMEHFSLRQALAVGWISSSHYANPSIPDKTRTPGLLWVSKGQLLDKPDQSLTYRLERVGIVWMRRYSLLLEVRPLAKHLPPFDICFANEFFQ